MCEKPPGIWLTLGGKCGSCTCTGEELMPPSASSRDSQRWRHPYSSQTWSCFLSQFLHLWVKHCYPGYNPVTAGCSQVCTVPLSTSKELSKCRNIKSFMFSTTKVEFFQSGVCLRVTKVHADDWLGLLPVVPSLQSTSNCYSSGKITSKITYHAIVLRSIYISVRVIASFRTKQRKCGFQY